MLPADPFISGLGESRMRPQRGENGDIVPWIRWARPFPARPVGAEVQWPWPLAPCPSEEACRRQVPIHDVLTGRMPRVEIRVFEGHWPVEPEDLETAENPGVAPLANSFSVDAHSPDPGGQGPSWHCSYQVHQPCPGPSKTELCPQPSGASSSDWNFPCLPLSPHTCCYLC